MQFSRKFKKQTNIFILNEKFMFSFGRALWNVPMHPFKSYLNFEISSISTISVFWAQILSPCKKSMTKESLLNEMTT